jgi:predicted Zn-ribbon and HTH transcriptional regulator
MPYRDFMVKMVEIRFKGYRCERCGHEWVPKSKNLPRVCPNCKSPYWDIPRKG